MTLRIVAIEHPAATTFRVSGRLVGKLVAELERAVESRAARGNLVVIDISDVLFVDAGGVAAMRGLVARGASVRGCPAYLVPQLYGSAS